MSRWKLTLEYDGAGFVGWQRQDNGPSLQAALEAAVLGFCGEAVTVQGAGRTDAGVHALGQIAHFDLVRDWPADTVRDAINAHLRPDPVAVVCAEYAPDAIVQLVSDETFESRGFPAWVWIPAVVIFAAGAFVIEWTRNGSENGKAIAKIREGGSRI